MSRKSNLELLGGLPYMFVDALAFLLVISKVNKSLLHFTNLFHQIPSSLIVLAFILDVSFSPTLRCLTCCKHSAYKTLWLWQYVDIAANKSE